MSDRAIMPFADYKAACDAIREKTDSTDLIKSGDMAGLINGISGGSGGSIETFTVSCDYTNEVTGIIFSYIDKNLEHQVATLGFNENELSVEVLKNSFILFTSIVISQNANGGFNINIDSNNYIKCNDTIAGCKVDQDIHFTYYPSELGNEPT